MAYEAFYCFGEFKAGLSHHPIAIFRQIGQHGEKAKPTNKRQSLVKIQLVKAKI